MGISNQISTKCWIMVKLTKMVIKEWAMWTNCLIAQLIDFQAVYKFKRASASPLRHHPSSIHPTKTAQKNCNTLHRSLSLAITRSSPTASVALFSTKIRKKWQLQTKLNFRINIQIHALHFCKTRRVKAKSGCKQIAEVRLNIKNWIRVKMTWRTRSTRARLNLMSIWINCKLQMLWNFEGARKVPENRSRVINSSVPDLALLESWLMSWIASLSISPNPTNVKTRTNPICMTKTIIRRIETTVLTIVLAN